MRPWARHLVAILTAASAACLATLAKADAPWWQDAVFYETFVRSFQDTTGSGVGSFDGIASRLDYLQGLGVTALWLMPVYPSPTYHGYDVSDYNGINADYGTPDTFRSLLASVHARGMRLILDIPLNHSSVEHPWFKTSEHDAKSPLRSRYVWRDTVPDWSAVANNAAHWTKIDDQYYFHYFSIGMPDLDWTNPDVYTDILAALNSWTDLGVDGFRLDAARYLVEGPHGEADTEATHQVWQRLVADVKARAPDTMFVGEVWTDQPTIATYYGSGDELDQCFGFPLAGSLVTSLKSGNASSFNDALDDELGQELPLSFLAPFLTNHDQVRVASVVGGDPAKLKLGAAALYTLPGTPYLYYGEEIGLPDGTLASQPGDYAKRTPMQWTPASADANRGFTTGKPWLPFATDAAGIDVASQDNDPDSLLNTYRALANLRRQLPELMDGDAAAAAPAAAAPGVGAFTRSLDDQVSLVILNFGAAKTSATSFTVDWSGSATVAVTYGNATASAKASGKSLKITVPALDATSAVVVTLRRPSLGFGATASAFHR